MIETCKKHDKISEDLTEIREALARIETSLEQGVATKDFVLQENDKIYSRVNTIVGGLAALLAVAGGTIAYLIK